MYSMVREAHTMCLQALVNWTNTRCLLLKVVSVMQVAFKVDAMLNVILMKNPKQCGIPRSAKIIL